MNYHNGASWTAIPSAALASTYRGTVHVEYPRAAEYDGLGAPCGAIGRPKIIIEAPMMTDTGFAFWRDLFASATSVHATVKLEPFDERTGAVTKLQGYLERPTHGGISQGSTAAKTFYRGVRIVVSACETTT